MGEPKFEFGSSEWLGLLKDTMTVAAAQAVDSEFSICEVYTDVPPRISAHARVAWVLRVKGGSATFLLEEADDVDIKIVGEWDVVAKLGRAEYGEEGPPPEVAADMAKATDEGRFQVKVSPTSSSPSPAFAGVHNQMARRTR